MIKVSTEWKDAIILEDYTNERAKLTQPQMDDVQHFEWNHLENAISDLGKVFWSSKLFSSAWGT